MDGIVIKVNNRILPKEVAKFKWKKSDISGTNAGRTQDTIMHKNRIGEKRTLSLGWTNLTKNEITEILNAFEPEYVNVTYWDPLAGIDVTKSFYTGDIDAEVRWWCSGKERYSSLDFDVIER